MMSMMHSNPGQNAVKNQPQGGGKGKKKKMKPVKMSLDQFLGGGTPGAVPKSQDWAVLTENPEDDMDLAPMKFDRSTLPSAPKAAMGPQFDLDMIPKNGPFSAYVGNLSYEAKEEDLANFFSGLEIDTIRIITDGGRPRGYAYVDFLTRESLLDALTCTEKEYMGRNIRVDLASEKNNQDSRGGGGMSGRGGDPDRTEGDWRRREPTGGDSSFGSRDSDRGGRYGDRDGGRGGDRDRGYGFGGDRDRDRGGDRERDTGGAWERGERAPADRDRGFGGDRDRGYGGGRDRDRGYGGDRDRDRGFGGDRDRDTGGTWERGFGGDRGGDRGYGGDRGGDRGYGGDRSGGRYGDDRSGGRDDRGGGYNRGRDDGYDRRPAGNDSGRESRDAPVERPRLKLAPRSKPAEDKENKPAQSSIFGSAKPVDTTSREREIAEKLSRDDKENKPSAPAPRASIFGSAKPVDTATREREIEKKLQTTDEPKPRSRREDNFRDAREEYRDRGSGDVSRSESEKSQPSEDALVPAPPPKENAWGRKKETDTSNNASQVSPSLPSEHRPAPSSDRRDVAPSDRRDGPPSDRRDAPPSDRRDAPPSDRRDATPSNWRDAPPPERRDAPPPRTNAWGRGGGSAGHLGAKPGPVENKPRPVKEKVVPKHYDEMPKFEENKGKDFASSNKFAFLPDEDNDDEGNYSDEQAVTS